MPNTSGSGSTPWVPKEGGEVLTEPQVLKKLEEELSKKSDKATSNDPALNVDLVVEPNMSLNIEKKCKQKLGSDKKINLNGFRVKDALTGHVLNVYLKSLIRKVNFVVRKNIEKILTLKTTLLSNAKNIIINLLTGL
ncbi:hypothetical protein BpHYR1_040122 [Brachionus plicatilis]|uniref:Uncharacterized protein n=1 Tax=Brachionus plicatilis TaxID=10195 RepID=A0A3M7QMP8_BRAPC|nr:hypothetical protein BpHYR1_040122 [Brachionus plicatilis]